jgi:ribosome-associated toxin RatA of RatAB toxin-antitoxin module
MLASFKVLPQQQGDGWVYEREKKGIKVFTKKSKWSKLRDCKATMTVSASPGHMLQLLTDFEHYDSWMPRCKKSRVVARLNDNEFVVYQVYNAPWPVKDRDCVIHFKIDKDAKTGNILITESSEPKFVRENADYVRITQLVATWKLIPQSNGGTEVINEYSSNPGGNIPDWLINTQSVESPLATFENLQEKAISQK